MNGEIDMDIDFQTMIGGYYSNCITGERYIVGASEKRNAALRENWVSVDELDKDQWVPLKIEATQITSENYADMRKPKAPMPKHCYGTSYGYAYAKEMKQILKEHYQSKNCSLSELKDYFKDWCRDMRVDLAQERRTTGLDPKHNEQIILDTYDHFRQCNSVIADWACDEEGKDIARKYGWKEGEQNKDWVYYNSDYYYDSKAVMQAIEEAAQELAAEWNIGRVDTSSRDQDDKAHYSSDFHQVWAHGSENGAKICKMIDQGKVPPEGFTMFYRDCILEQGVTGGKEHVGILDMGIGKGSSTVHVRRNLLYYIYDAAHKDMKLPQIYHLREVFKNQDASYADYYKYLANFDVYTYDYGMTQTSESGR